MNLRFYDRTWANGKKGNYCLYNFEGNSQLENGSVKIFSFAKYYHLAVVPFICYYLVVISIDWS